MWYDCHSSINYQVTNNLTSTVHNMVFKMDKINIIKLLKAHNNEVKLFIKMKIGIICRKKRKTNNKEHIKTTTPTRLQVHGLGRAHKVCGWVKTISECSPPPPNLVQWWVGKYNNKTNHKNLSNLDLSP